MTELCSPRAARRNRLQSEYRIARTRGRLLFAIRYSLFATRHRYSGLLGDDVVQVERLVDGGEPFGARCRPPPALLVDGQLEGLEQRPHLLPRRHMRQVRPGAEGGLVHLVEGREAARKQLAID